MIILNLKTDLCRLCHKSREYSHRKDSVDDRDQEHEPLPLTCVVAQHSGGDLQAKNIAYVATSRPDSSDRASCASLGPGTDGANETREVDGLDGADKGEEEAEDTEV